MGKKYEYQKKNERYHMEVAGEGGELCCFQGARTAVNFIYLKKDQEMSDPAPSFLC